MPRKKRDPEPKAVPAWRRVEPGAYRSADERFELRSVGAGRWFLVDRAEMDELGQPRTEGPLPTLDAAKGRAAARRESPAEASPLAARIAEAASRPPPHRKPARRAAAPGAGAARGEGTAPRPAPPERTWLDDLGVRDGGAARRARSAIDALVREGEDRGAAAAAVRRELEDGVPAVAELRLARAAARAVEAAASPETLARVAPGLAASDPGALARAVASAALRAIAGELEAGGRHGTLPGWQLVEHPAGAPEPGRRLRLEMDGG